MSPAGAFAALERASSGRFWVPRLVLGSWALAFFFSVPGYERFPEAIASTRPFWNRFVQHTIDHPLSDLARIFPAETNMAKRTFRITTPGVARLFGTGAWGAWAFGYVCGYVSLHAAALLSERILRSRAAASLVVLMLASSYFGSAAFKDAGGWFDSVSFAFLLVAAGSGATGWRSAALLAAFFNDERAILVAPATLLGSAADARSGALRRQAAALCAALAGYAALRAGATAFLDLGTARAGIEWSNASGHAERLFACLWSAFEGGWLLLLAGLPGLARSRWQGLGLLAVFLGFAASCFLVVDLTRSLSFAWVFVFPLLAGLSRELRPGRLRSLLAAASLLTLVAPNLFEWDYLDFELGLVPRLAARLAPDAL